MVRWFGFAAVGAAVAGLVVAQPALAATAVGLEKSPAVASLAPAEVVPSGLTSTERPAHLTWSLRAALNVAALQCQFSPYLASVNNYNELLKHHSAELASSYKTMGAHFKRTAGKRAQKDFDVYTTRTYNSYSTLLAQLQFCETAAIVAREALAMPKGSLAKLAMQRVPDLRASLTPRQDPLTMVQLDWVAVPTIPNPCLDKRGRLRKKC
jgi:hypothetical protein